MMHLVAVLLIGNSTFFKMFFEMISLSERFCGILLLSVLLYGVEETEKNIWNLTVGWVGTILNNVMCGVCLEDSLSKSSISSLLEFLQGGTVQNS